ncbi:MAG: DUF4395 domain-containing protein [Acidimicrobiales bacterium]
MGQPRRLLDFPNPVDDVAARVVAGGVVAMAGAAIVLDEPVLMVPLTYGFAARVACGPRFSPLGLLATRIVAPRIPGDHRLVPGPPKRLAQGAGLGLSATALVLRWTFGRRRAANLVLGALVAAASLEAAFGLCLACKAFPLLMRLGIVPESTCRECADIWAGQRGAGQRGAGQRGEEAVA